jgi:RND family efflux transporter MFP subunit
MSQTDFEAPVHESKLTSAEKKAVWLFCILVIVFTAFAANFVASRSKKPKKKQEVVRALPVNVLEINKTTKNVMINVMGEVIASKEVVVTPRVSGEIVRVHGDFVEGGFVKKGQSLIKIDKSDYKIALTNQRANLAKARAAYDLEMGRQDVAKSEWKALGKGDDKSIDKSLALRKPQLVEARANVNSALANVKLARLNLGRTNVKAPFDCLIKQTYVDEGAQVSNQSKIADIVGVDKYYLKASIALEKLKWIKIPSGESDLGAVAFVKTTTGAVRQGRVVKLLSDLESKGRMARVLIEIKDPLDLKEAEKNKRPILLGEYVEADIEGIELKSVYAISRQFFRDDDRLYFLDDESKLKIVSPKIVYKGKDEIFVRGLEGQTKLITSDILTPVEKMDLKNKNEKKYVNPFVDEIEKEEVK